MLGSPASPRMLITEGEPVAGVSALVTLLAAVLVWRIGHALAKRVMGDGVNGLEVVVVSGALTLACLIALGLVLHSLEGLHAGGWLLSIGALGLIATLSLGWNPGSLVQSMSQWPVLSRGNALLLAAAACLALLAIQQARYGALAHREFDFTEFWLLRDDQSGSQFVLGLANHERETVSYSVDILLDDRLAGVWTGIEVESGSSWITALIIPASLGSSQRIEGLLYRNGDRETVYRRVWVDIKPDV